VTYNANQQQILQESLALFLDIGINPVGWKRAEVLNKDAESRSDFTDYAASVGR
jgi:hypothetical protein